MIKKYSIKFPWHKNGMAIKAEFPISPVVGRIVGVACVLRRTNEATTRDNSIDYVGFDDLMTQVNKGAVLRGLGKVSFATDEGEVFSYCTLTNQRTSLNKRTVPVDYRKPFSRMVVVVEENDFLDANDFVDVNLVRLQYTVDVYVITRKEGDL